MLRNYVSCVREWNHQLLWCFRVDCLSLMQNKTGKIGHLLKIKKSHFDPIKQKLANLLKNEYLNHLISPYAQKGTQYIRLSWENY